MRIKAKVVQKKEVTKKIDTDFIRLDSFLKMNDAVQSGGHAKIVIQEGEVMVNGETEFQRGKKLYDGDTVSFRGEEIRIVK